MKLHLDIFEGPLDLLLYLIRKNNLEISKISLSQVTAQYLDYLNTMQELNVDLASDFLYMAAELAHLKSTALLPKPEKMDNEDDESDQADNLVRKLRVYQQFKDLAMQLAARKLLHRDVFTRGSFPDFGMELEAGAEIDDVPEEQAPDEYDVNSYELVRAFSEILKKLPQEKREHRVVAERVSITERIYEILDSFKQGGTILFVELFANQNEKIDVVVTFLAVLEMAKLKMIRVHQPDSFGPIRLERRLETVADDELKDLKEHVEQDLGEHT